MTRGMEVATTRDELAKALTVVRDHGHTLAFVPTMGALHEGHRSLLHRARDLADAVAVSIFVNAMQFGPDEDLARYPRTLNADIELCADEGVALVFAPAADVIYPHQPEITIDPGPVGDVLEGATRPGHFTGVLTVVAKLFHLLQPDVAVFGQKDAQQLALIRRMVADLDFPVQIEAVPTVRDPDGLAVSSRNRYLSAAERVTALALYGALRAGATRERSGADDVRAEALRVLHDASHADPPLRLDYLAIVDPGTFVEVGSEHEGPAILAIAAYVGTTRLIDHQPLVIGDAAAVQADGVEAKTDGAA